MNTEDRWAKMEELVIFRLDDNARKIERMDTRAERQYGSLLEAVQSLEKQVATLKVRSSIWGGVTGGSVAAMETLRRMLMGG